MFIVLSNSHLQSNSTIICTKHEIIILCMLTQWCVMGHCWQAKYKLLHPFNSLFSRTAWVSWYQKGKTSLDLNEARDDGVLACGGISWTICKRSAPRSRQITTPTPHHSIFTSWMHCTSRRPTNSVKALKAHGFEYKLKKNLFEPGHFGISESHILTLL